MVLSDATIARLLAEGRIEIDPYDDTLLQPSSVDVRVDRFFRVFHNNRYPFIDVKVEQSELTELVEVEEEQREGRLAGARRSPDEQARLAEGDAGGVHRIGPARRIVHECLTACSWRSPHGSAGPRLSGSPPAGAR